MPYVDGYVLAVPTANKEAYRMLAAASAEVFKAWGALSVVETWGDDVPDGVVTSFPMAVKKQDDETVVFSWAVWPDKATRDAAMARAMGDEALTALYRNNPPFDGKRMIFGGFEVLVEA